MSSRIHAAFARARELFRARARFDAEQQEEFDFHMEMETAENVRLGMTESDARRAAVIRFGGARRYREDTSDARGVAAVDNLARDARFAVRRLRRAPAFSLGVITTLGLGIGAAVGIGTTVYGVLLRPLPYDDPDRLVRVGFFTPGLNVSGDLNSAATYFQFATAARSFAALGAYWTSDDFNVVDGDAPERVTVALMTPNVYTLLGAHPLLGQLFEPGDSSWSNTRAAVLISESFWRRRYGADPGIVGRRIDINRGARVVIGVLPRSFDFPKPGIDIFYPAPVAVNQSQITVRAFNVVGRLRARADARAAAAELNAVVWSIPARFPKITTEMLRQADARVTVVSLRSAMVAPIRAQLGLLGLLVGLVLLIATTNVVNLFLLRTERASQEIAIALSLGATRTALAQRFVVEGALVGMASSLVALTAAALTLSTKFGFTEREIPRLHEVAFTWSTLALVVICTCTIGAALGLVAFARTDVTGVFDRLRSARATSSPGWRRLRDGLVALQVAVALVMLVAAGLLGRSFWNLRNANIGFVPRNAMTFHASLPWNGYTTYAADVAFHARALDRFAALPGITSAGVALSMPLAGRGASAPTLDLRPDDRPGQPTTSATGNMASANYFSVMGIPLLAGRTFRAGDLRGVPAAIIGERLARDLFGTTNVVGRVVDEIIVNRKPYRFRIVGVVGDVQLERIEDGPAPMLYFPLQRDGDGLPADSNAVPARPMDVQFVLRGPRLPRAATIQAIVKDLDHRIPATNIRSLGSLVDDATARVRLTMFLIAVAGGAALLLGVVGVYTVASYAASGRSREFGIRLALGASPTDVARIVLSDGMRVVAIGTVAGLAVSVGATRLLRALLYEVNPASLPEFAEATMLLVIVTLCATMLPARRAARTHSAAVLRGE